MINIIRECPRCKSKNIKGGISLNNGNYVQTIVCLECKYSNHRIVGDAKNGR